MYLEILNTTFTFMFEHEIVYLSDSVKTYDCYSCSNLPSRKSHSVTNADFYYKQISWIYGGEIWIDLSVPPSLVPGLLTISFVFINPVGWKCCFWPLSLSSWVHSMRYCVRLNMALWHSWLGKPLCEPRRRGDGWREGRGKKRTREIFSQWLSHLHPSIYAGLGMFVCWKHVIFDLPPSLPCRYQDVKTSRGWEAWGRLSRGEHR